MPDQFPPPDSVKPGVLSTEFFITLVLTLGSVAAGIILIAQGKTEQGTNLFYTAAGSGGLYTAARSFVKR